MNKQAVAKELVAISKELVRNDGKDVFRGEVESLFEQAMTAQSRGDMARLEDRIHMMQISARGLKNRSLDRKLSSIRDSIEAIKKLHISISKVLQSFRSSDFE